MFATSVSGFLEPSNKESVQILVENLDEANAGNSHGAILFQWHVWQYRDHFARVSRQETDVLPKFSYIKSVVTYLLDT